jgi:hypothetical protein
MPHCNICNKPIDDKAVFCNGCFSEIKKKSIEDLDFDSSNLKLLNDGFLKGDFFYFVLKKVIQVPKKQKDLFAVYFSTLEEKQIDKLKDKYEESLFVTDFKTNRLIMIEPFEENLTIDFSKYNLLVHNDKSETILKIKDNK